jgi:hypothetical protein
MEVRSRLLRLRRALESVSSSGDLYGVQESKDRRWSDWCGETVQRKRR